MSYKHIEPEVIFETEKCADAEARLLRAFEIILNENANLKEEKADEKSLYHCKSW